MSKELLHLLKIPVNTYNNVLTVLELSHFAPLFDHFNYAARKEMSLYVVNNVLEHGTLIPTQEKVDALLQMVNTLVVDQADQPEELVKMATGWW